MIATDAPDDLRGKKWSVCLIWLQILVTFFHLILPLWAGEVTAARKQQLSLRASSVRTCARNYPAAGAGPRLTMLQGNGAIRPQPRLPTDLLHYHGGDGQPRCAPGLPHSSSSAAGEPERSLQSCAAAGEPSWGSLPSLPSGGLSLMAPHRNKVISV